MDNENDIEREFKKRDAAFQGELAFRGRYIPMAMGLGINANPDDPEHFYDYRGLDQAVQRGEFKPPTARGGHFPSNFKTEGHPRTYLDDTKGRVFDTRSTSYLNGEQVPQKLLAASESSPDMPGFDPERLKTLISAIYGKGMR